MSLEAIDIICQAEEAAIKLKADAAAAAKRAVEMVGEEGRAAMAQLESRVKAELKIKSEEAQARAKAEVESIAAENAAEKAALSEKAQAQLDEAVKYIVERIVNG